MTFVLAMSIAAALAACSSSSGRVVVTPTTNATPTTPEVSPSGDIPDNQAFVKYSASEGLYGVEVPEGWARTTSGPNVTFGDHFNSIRIAPAARSTAPTVATARATQVPSLERNQPGFVLRDVSTVTRTAGTAVLVTFRAESAADAVTGKRIVLDVESYEFWHNGTSVTLTLASPKGSDNVDPWKKVTDSFTWLK
jgi:hypothetical protein